MDNSDWSAFQEYLDASFEQYGKPPLSDRGARMMFENLRDLDLKTVISGMNAHIRMNRYVPPNAASLRELIAEEFVADAFEKVQQARRITSADESIRFDDPLIHAAITKCGGWPSFYFYDKSERWEKFMPAYIEAFRKRMNWDDVPDHLSGEREQRGSVLNPWSPDQIVNVGELAEPTQKQLTA